MQLITLLVAYDRLQLLDLVVLLQHFQEVVGTRQAELGDAIRYGGHGAHCGAVRFGAADEIQVGLCAARRRRRVLCLRLLYL